VTAGFLASGRGSADSGGFLNSVTGPLPLDKLGLTLMHEHVLVDFIGADKITSGRYNPVDVFHAALPHLKKAFSVGCRTLVECTPAYLGRDPALLRRLSEASGVQIITNTGYYSANRNKHVPAHAFAESAADLARRWSMEFLNGIEGTGIKPGLIKIGVDKGPLTEIGRKLVMAAALTHRRTGLTIASHTGDGAAALEQIDLLAAEGVSPSAFIWVHAQNEKRSEVHRAAADKGAMLEFDGVSESSAGEHIALVKSMVEAGHIGQTLISMDAGWYHVGEPNGGNYRGYDYLLTGFLALLRSAGIEERQIQALLVENPRETLRPGFRLL
jgi:phosphotriesterase-related protein